MVHDVCWVQEGYSELAVKEEAMKLLLLTAQELMSQTADKNFSEMTSRFQKLSKQLLDVRAKADKHKVSHVCVTYLLLRGLLRSSL